ncbi:MAG TPA: hypothetical protein PK413_03935 [Thermoanaerobaculia bacterium]|nr:hypothetical protein [Thermoanaerobaculia bacterium]
MVMVLSVLLLSTVVAAPLAAAPVRTEETVGHTAGFSAFWLWFDEIVGNPWRILEKWGSQADPNGRRAAAPVDPTSSSTGLSSGTEVTQLLD